MNFYSGFIGFLGPPNSGKSTLFNRILGRKLAIVSPRPQTTRNRITGVYNEEGCQMIFVDMPGVHRATGPLHRSMVDSALAACREVDLLVLVAGVTNLKDEGMAAVLTALRTARKPALLALNKIDLVATPKLLPIMDQAGGLYPFEAIIPVSARKGDGISRLLEEIRKRLEHGPRFFPEHVITDQPETFFAAEIIREKIYYATRQELPYAAAVTVESMERREKDSLMIIRALIHVEKERQKAILIGEKGKTIKTIGTMARKELEQVMGKRIYLDLAVRVEKDWTRDPRSLRKLGY